MDSDCVRVDNTFGPHAGFCRGGFDFTLLFEESILTIPLLSLLLLVTPFRIYYLLRRDAKVERSTLLLWKLLALVIFTGIQLAGLILWTRPTTIRTTASTPAAALSFIGSLFLLVLSYAEHVFNVRPSTIINIYLLLSILFDAARSRTLWLQPYNHAVAGVLVTSTAVKIVVLILETCEKRRILRPQYAHISPEGISGILSRFLFLWQLPLFRIGYSKSLEIEDLYSLDKHMESHYLHNSIHTAWNKAAKESSYALFKTVLRTLKWPLLSIVFPRLCYIGFTFAQPFLINTTIIWSERPQGSPDDNNGYGLIGAYLFVYVGIAVSMGQHQHLTSRAITMMRGQLISMLYHKATDLSITTADPESSLTLISADIERIDNGWRTMHEIWANLVEIGVAVYLLERQLGVACLVPVAVALFSIIGSVIAVSLVMARQALWLEAIERRVAVTSAMLGSMKGVKMCGLTNHLLKQIQDMRLDELRISEKFRKLLIWNMGLAFLTPLMAPVLTFMTYILLARNSNNGATLDNARAFTSLTLFALLQEPLSSFIMSLNSFVGSVGCFVRIQSFLQSDTRIDPRKKTLDGPSNTLTLMPTINEEKIDSEDKGNSVALPQLDGQTLNETSISITNGTFAWRKDKPYVLSNINVEIPMGKFTIVIGPVGCGKSTLLKAFLGEVGVIEGSVLVSATEIAYCDQTAWHMNGTIRQSIVAFSGEDERWYQTVLRACALEQDLQQFPKRDRTVIGSKGVVLSGGQSQRIALARAVYAQKSLIILDDAFSGLDSHTENTIFHNLLGTDGILRRLNTTVIIASSHSKRVSYADHIICLDSNGHICEQGSFNELEKTGGYIAKLNVQQANWNLHQLQSLPNKSSLSSMVPSSDSATALSKQEGPSDQDEEVSRRTGDVTIYLYYTRAIGWIPVAVFVFAICAFIFCQSFPTIWVNWWAAANATRPNERLGYYLGIYAMLGVLALISLCISCWQMIVTMVPLSGKNFHWSLLKTVLDSPMAFFSETDSGITINRFSQDLQLIDMDLPIAALNTFATFVLCIAQMILFGVGSKYAAVSFPFLLAALYVVQRIYLRTSRQLRFLDLEAKSPLYSQFTESLGGLPTIRAFGWRTALERMHYKLLNQSQQPYYLLYAVQRWLTLVLDMFVAGLAVLLMIIIVELRGILSPGLIGVALTNIILFSQNLKLLMTFWTLLETHIGAVSRIKSFTSHAVSEHLVQEKDIPPSNWPSKGEIKFEEISAGYKAGESILKNVSFTINAGEKVGVCGRTGSGKSSMVATIFRMADLHGGKITIDGIDISAIPREEVRTRIIGVPQDTFLLEDTVRINADPSGLHPDGAIVSALQSVQLWDTINSKGGLNSTIKEAHLSHGQRQLFCLARAMLRPSPILILDEATSSIDTKTDSMLQRTIRERFTSHTVIAIVHKLESILDFDKIALLDGGELVEFDSPHALLSRPDSAFSSLYKTIGAENTAITSGTSNKLISESSRSRGSSSKASQSTRT